MYGINDLYLECLRAAILAALLLYLLIPARHSRFASLAGARLIVSGFALLLLATLFDISDEVPGLERFVIIGATEAETYIETVGYLAAFITLFAGFVRIIPSIARLDEVSRELCESEEKFRTIFETIPDIVSITRLDDGTVVDLSPAVQDVTGRPRASFIGRTVASLKGWTDPADRDRMVRELQDHGAVRNMEVQLNAGPGEVRDCLVSACLMQLRGEPHILTVFKDITERKAVVQALQQSEARFRLIFEASPDPLIIARIDGGGIIDVNRAFVAETGISRDDAIGKTSAELNLWANPGQRQEFLELLRRDGEVSNFEGHFRRKNGEVRIYLASARLIRLGGLPCILLDTRDVTREKQVEAALVEMDRMKSEFISMAAHELRTPLTTMLGYTELLSDADGFGGFSVEQRAEFLDEIYQKGETLSRIIDEMLDISRIEAGHQITLERLPHDPKDFLNKTVRRFEMQSARHAFRIEMPGVQPTTLLCDLHRLTQVLDNLLSNAIKYSPRGGIITVAGQVQGDDYVVTVTDQGIGMSEDEQARVFDKFYRADSSNTAVGGLGLGMSIARQIVEAHGGRIWVESASGVGTAVSFSLPLQA